MRESVGKGSKTKAKPVGKTVSTATKKAALGVSGAKSTKKAVKAPAAKKAGTAVKKAVAPARPTKPAGKTTTPPAKKAAKPAPKATPAKKSVKEKPKPVVAKPKAEVKKPVKAETKVKNHHSAPLPVHPPILTIEPMHRLPSPIALKVFEQAVKVFNRKQYAEAKTMFENILARYPQEVEILARVHTYIQVCVQKLAQTQMLPRNAEELYDRGVFALNIGDFTMARTFFEKALRIKPDEPHLLYSMAATMLQTGSVDQALEYLKRSIQLQPRFRAQALNDSDFSELRENRQFLQLLGLASPFELLESRK